MSSQVQVTNYPAIKNAPLVGLAEGNGSFNNYHLAALVVVVPYVVKSFIPIVKYGGFKTYLFMLVLCGAPTAIFYWTVNSRYGSRKNEKVALPGKDIEEYITINDPELKMLYKGKEKIPMQVFYDAYFDSKIDFNGAFACSVIIRRVRGLTFRTVSQATCLISWSSVTTGPRWCSLRSSSNMSSSSSFLRSSPILSPRTRSRFVDTMTVSFLTRDTSGFALAQYFASTRFFFVQAVTTSTNGSSCYVSCPRSSLTRPNRFLGPRMIYTSGIILNPDIEESLEQLQDNKLAVVCNKLDLKPTDK